MPLSGVVALLWFRGGDLWGVRGWHCRGEGAKGCSPLIRPFALYAWCPAGLVVGPVCRCFVGRTACFRKRCRSFGDVRGWFLGQVLLVAARTIARLGAWDAGGRCRDCLTSSRPCFGTEGAGMFEIVCYMACFVPARLCWGFCRLGGRSTVGAIDVPEAD